MRHRWRQILVGLSLGIFALTVLLWAHSYTRGGWFGWVWQTIENDVARDGQAGIGWGRGQLWIGFKCHRVTPLEGETFRGRPGVPEQPWNVSGWGWTRPMGILRPPGEQQLGFGGVVQLNRPFRRITNVQGVESQCTLVLPHWFLALLSAILPAWHFYGRKDRLRRWRREHNLCLACGYDLRESPQRCPECGQATAE